MAINLPNSPTNGQTVTVGNKTLVYSTSLSVWQIQSSPAGATVTTSDTAPASPSDGDMWFDSATLNTFIYYADGSSNQWVKANPSGSTGPQGIQGVAGADGASGGNGVATIVADMAGLIALSGMSAGAQAYVTSNNRLYFYNGSGWYLIATVQNNAPSAITGVDGTYALDMTGSATTITAVSTDPEGFALTWSYATSGLGSIATVSQTDNVFTITPSTVDANAGTFTLTISATDGVNGAVNAVTSMSLAFKVTNSRYTSLLMSANAAGTNSTFSDSSSSNHTITPSGTPTQGSFNPYRKGGYSLSSEKGSAGSIGTASDDYAIKLADSADFDVASGEDFTYEFWFKADPQPAGDVWPATSTILTSLREVFYGGNGWYPQVRLTRWTSGAYAGKDAMSVYINSQFKDLYTEIDRSVWNHICIIRSSNVWKFYINGTEDTYQPGWVSSLYWPFTESAPVIAQGAWAGNDGVYIKDFRYVVGTAIVPPAGGPSEPLSVVSGTKFLLCSLPYFADANNTADGGLAPKTVIHGDYISKIIPSSPYDYGSVNTTDGGSIYLDGTGYLTTPNNTDFDLVYNNFTIKFWMYPISVTGYNKAVQRYDNTAGSWSFGIQADKTVRLLTRNSGGLTNNIFSSKLVSYNQWYYVEISPTTVKLNGETWISSSNTALGTHTNNKPLIIGSGANNSGVPENGFHGYIADFQIVNGGTAIESTIPTTPMSTDSNAKIHLKLLESKVFDLSQSSNLALIGNTTGHATNKGGNWSNTFSTYFDGSGDYLVVPASSEINFGTSDFTVEFWINFAAFPSNGYILNKEDSSGNDFTLQYYQNAIKVSNATVGSGWSHYSSGIGSLSTGTWYHIAYCRSSGTLKSYKDGTEVNSATDSRNYNLNNAITLGSRYPGDYAANVYIQDLRITKGLAHYTANFTPPTAPLKG